MPLLNSVYSNKKRFGKKKEHYIFSYWMSCYDSFYFALISFDFSEVCSYRSNDFCITAFNILESTVVMFVRLRLSENNVVKAICSPVEKSFINFEYTAWFITFLFFLCTEVSIYGSLVCYFSLSASQHQWESSFSCILDYTSSNMIIIPMYICFFFLCMPLTFSVCIVQIYVVVWCMLLDAQ